MEKKVIEVNSGKAYIITVREEKGYIRISQRGGYTNLHPADLPALIAALQEIEKEVGNE